MTALIDADSIIYIVAWKNKDTEDPQLVKHQVNEFMTDLIKFTGADSYLGVFSPKKTFRNSITDDYKANRPPSPDWVVKWKKTIMDYCIEEYGFVIAEDHEADDVLSIMQGGEVIHCHIDKDLYQIPGYHYDYRKQSAENFNPEEYKKFVTPQDAMRNFWKQVLVGDTSDNVKGAWKIGPVKAEKILSEVNVTDPFKLELLDWYDDAYKFVTKEAFKKQNGETWLEDYEKAVSLIRLLPPTPELVEKYRLNIQKVKIEQEQDLVEDILNHGRVLESTERPHEDDLLRLASNLS
jgi:5'-3' exonuclease